MLNAKSLYRWTYVTAHFISVFFCSKFKCSSRIKWSFDSHTFSFWSVNVTSLLSLQHTRHSVSSHLATLKSLKENSINSCTQNLMSSLFTVALVSGVISTAGNICAFHPRRIKREWCVDRVGNKRLPSLCRVPPRPPSSES